MSAAIVWFRQDLRLADNPALARACEDAAAVYPLFIWAPEEAGEWAPGAATRVWLHHSLQRLDESLRQRGSALILRRGPSLQTLLTLASTLGVRQVFWNRCYEPMTIARDTVIKRALRDAGIEVTSFNGALLHEPASIRSQAGAPFKVFTPFWRQCLKQPEPSAPLPAPVNFNVLPSPVESLPLAALQLLPRLDWDAGIREHWQAGEAAAQSMVLAFTDGRIDMYPEQRDRPDINGVSRLSPYLHFGELGPRQLWAMVGHAESAAGRLTPSAAAQGYLRQLVWREFAHHLLYHFPQTATSPLRPEFERFPWRDDPEAIRRWQRGETGYPIVDAGMRELWVTGWMHNRVRMIVASFLVKHLLQHWLHGARWFWDTLVDADLANNTMGWQWTAGCGADAAPYFRIFNPISQGERFDPHGVYVRKWLPALAVLPQRYLHAPWRAPAADLAAAGVRLGENYPLPIVEHDAARQRALAAWEQIRK